MQVNFRFHLLSPDEANDSCKTISWEWVGREFKKWEVAISSDESVNGRNDSKIKVERKIVKEET